MNSFVLKCVIAVLFHVLILFYHRADGLEVDFYRVMPYEIICLLGMLFLPPNAYFLYIVLVFHTYTDERIRMAYVLPTILAGVVEGVVLYVSGTSAGSLVELAVCVVIVHILSFCKVFGEGDAYYMNVLLMGAVSMGVSAFGALFVIFYIACISFILRMFVINVVNRLYGRESQRRSAFMGSILCGYVVFCLSCI